MKKMFILSLILIILFSSGFVFANDVNETNLTTNTDMSILENTEDNTVNTLTENNLLKTDNGTFSDLQNKINNASEGSTISLENDYIYDDGFDSEGISISKTLTIQGNGHSIDALKKSRIFKVTANSIVLINLTLKNGYSNLGGAVYVNTINSGNVFDCNFVNNSAGSSGGAIYFNTASNNDIFKGIFESNSAKDGGAIYFNSKLSYATFNGFFVNNTASRSGGAIYQRYSETHGLNNIFYGSFVNNSAGSSGGAIFKYYVGMDNFYGSFVNNSAGSSGGALYAGYISDTYFGGHYINNKANNGGAIFMSYVGIADGASKVVAIFENNSAGSSGGAIYFSDVHYSNVLLDKSIFVYNIAKKGSAIYLNEVNKDINIFNCIFNYNKADSQTLELFFDDSHEVANVVYRGNNNILNAIYSIYSNVFNFSNVTYWGDGGYLNSDDVYPLFSDYESGQDIVLEIYDNSTKMLVSNFTGVTNNKGVVKFNCSSLSNNIFNCYYNIYHPNDFYYTLITKTNTFKESAGDFNNLLFLIFNSDDNDIIYLTQDYIYTPGVDTITSGILINKNNLTINGNNHIIDALGHSRIFNIDVETINLINITFKNGFTSSDGGAIAFNKLSNSYFNVTFVNNTARESGGAIYVGTDSRGNVFDCNFIDNSAGSGGAIYFKTDSYDDVFNSIFDGNSAKDGGAIYFNSKLSYATFNGFFVNNTASRSGGAIYHPSNSGSEGTSNKFYGSFVNNSAGSSGGAIFKYYVGRDKFYSSFMNNSAGSSGGALYTGYISDTYFGGHYINNKASNGGAIFMSYVGIPLNGPSNVVAIFENNSASSSGGAIYFSDVHYSNVLLDKSIFFYNIAKKGSAIYLNEVNRTVICTNSILLNDFDDLIIYSDMKSNIQFINCWFGNTADNYNISPNVNENIQITNWLFLNGTANPIKILKNKESFISFTLTNLYNNITKEISNIKYNLPNINLMVSSTNGNLDKNSIMVNEYVTYILTGDSDGEIIANYGEISYLVNIESLNNVSLIAPNNTIYYGQYENFIVTLTKNNISLINEPIKITFNNQSNIFYTNDSGQVSIDLYLDAGNYEIVCEYYDLVVYSNHLVNKGNSSLIICNFNGTAGHEIILTANVSSFNNLTINRGSVVFYDGDTKIGESNVNNCVATLIYVPTTDGEHNIKAIFSSDNYLSSNDTSKLYVDSASVEIIANTGTVGYNSTFVANVKGLYSIINEGIISFYIGNEFIDKTSVINGTASLIYVPLVAGNSVVKAVFGDSEKFLSSDSSVNFTVNQADSQVSIDNLTGRVGDNLILSANVTSPNGLIINEGTLTFIDNGNVIGVEIVENGKASINYVPNNEGKHTISAVFLGNNYITSNDVLSISIDKANTELILNNIANTYYGAAISISANVLANGKSIKEGIIKFYINGQEIKSFNLVNEQISFDYLASNAGLFNITAMFFESDNYLSSQSSQIFEVNKLPTFIVSSSIDMIYNVGNYITATLKDSNGKALNGVQVSININGVKYLTTDKNGQVRLFVTGLVPKTYTATITFDGNTNYVKSTTTVKVTVKKATPKITAKAKTFKKSVKTKKYSITLKTNQNKVMKNVKLTIKVNKKTYTAKTNNKGVATFKITKLTKKGAFKAIVTYKGDKYYNKVTKKVNIKIK